MFPRTLPAVLVRAEAQEAALEDDGHMWDRNEDRKQVLDRKEEKMKGRKKKGKKKK